MRLEYWLESLKWRPHGRPRYRWEDYIKMVLREIRFRVVDWKNLAQSTNQWQALKNTEKTFAFHERQGMS
jgi:hypothetical protein